jgi:hypothetical protein
MSESGDADRRDGRRGMNADHFTPHLPLTHAMAPPALPVHSFAPAHPPMSQSFTSGIIFWVVVLL